MNTPATGTFARPQGIRPPLPYVPAIPTPTEGKQ